MRCLLFCKKGEGPIWPVVLFLILNLMFFVLLAVFVFRASSGALIYEQAYAKEVALMIDKARPGMEISLDVEEGINIAEKNGFVDKETGEGKDKIFKVDNEKNIVIVQLAPKGSYSYNFFTDYEVEKLEIESTLLKIKIKGEGGENE